MSRWFARGLLSLAAAGALAAGLAGQAYAAPPTPEPTDRPDPALQQAVRRDLGISWEEYLTRGAQAERASELDRQLAGTPGYRGVVLQGSQIVVTGDGSKVDGAARAKGARVTAAGRRAASADPMLQKYLTEVGPDGLAALQVTADGWTVTVDQPDRARTNRSGRAVTPQQFAEQNPGVEVRAGRPAERRAVVLGGQGWVGTPAGVLCSVGFAGFDTSGRQEMLTAGHCTRDNSVDQAWLEADRSQFLGNRTFSQFGGPNNATNTQSTAGTDISIFGGAQQDLRPLVDTYGGESKVTGVVTPVVGAPVCDSGRTSRSWRCSTITGVGPFAVYGFRGDDDVRWVNGFETPMTTLGGDSGGSMVSGLKAVGVLSAGGNYGGVEYSFGSDLAVYRQQLGRQIEIYLGTPSAPPAAPGSTVTGRVPVDRGDTIAPGTTVRVDGANGTVAQVATDGSFTFTAPSNGTAVTLTVQNGFSRSGSFTWDPRYGSATGPRNCGLRDGGCFQNFATGAVYWSPNSGEHQVRGRIYDKWGSLGWENGRLGYPTGDEQCGLAGGGCYQQFQGGRIYWSLPTDAHPVWGEVGKEYQAVGAEQSTLKYPTGDEICGLRDGGCRQEFTGGSIGWSAKTGAHAVWGRIAERWNNLGAQNGMLGWPTSGEMCGLSEGGCWQRFSEGRMYYTPQLGANPIKGAIGQKWDATGFENGTLGYPTGQEYCGLAGNGCLQRFQRGSIYWSPATGAYWIRGAIRDSWGANGWEAGRLGYPTSDEQCWIAGGCFQTFTGGSIYWSGPSGAWPVWGAIREYWGANGWEAGRFGYPTSGESCTNSGTPQAVCRQSFQKGTITDPVPDAHADPAASGRPEVRRPGRCRWFPRPAHDGPGLRAEGRRLFPALPGRLDLLDPGHRGTLHPRSDQGSLGPAGLGDR